MNRKIVVVSKILGLVAFYSLILVASVFFTMSILIKGEELRAPDLVGKNLNEAYKMAANKGVYLKKVVGNYDQHYKPLTIIDQLPAPGTWVKEKSFVKVFVASELIEVIVPDLSGHSLKEIESILRESDLKKRFVSYMESAEVPVDFLVCQSYPPGVRVPRGAEIDLLVSKGKEEPSFIMPDLIGMELERVATFFEIKGLKTAKITEVPYPGLRPGIIIKQFPSSGFRINSKNLIDLRVSK
jgi:serine/threonine-protein kinase